MRTARRRLFHAAITILGYSSSDAAKRVGCSYNHLMLVLDGRRRPSRRLAAAIDGILRDATLLESLADAEVIEV